MEVTKTKGTNEAVGIYETHSGTDVEWKKKGSQDQNTKEHHHFKGKSKGNKTTKQIVGWWSERQEMS